MTFVHPLLLGGLLLVGIPVLIHLIMQQKPKQLPFPAFRFLLQRHRTNQRTLRLRHLLLLALRILLIAAVCLALARPKLFSERLSIGSGQPVAAVLLLDTSYSMEYTHAGRTRLDDAKQRALELLDEMPGGSKVAIFDSAEAGGEWLPTVTLARERITGLRLRHANGPVTRQIDQAYRLFTKLEQEQSDEEALPRLLYVFSDRTQECWDASQAKNLKQPEGIRAVFVDVGVEKPADVAIVDLQFPQQPGRDSPQQVFGDKDRALLRATVRATGTGCNTELLYRVDKKEAGRQPVVLKAGESRVFPVEIACRDFKAGPHEVEVELRTNDALPFNNARFATFEIRGGRQILVLADKPAEAELWKRSLEVTGRFHCDVRPSDKPGELIPNELLKTHKAVCLFNVARPNPRWWVNLKTYVEKGGGLAVIPGGEELNKELYNDSATAGQVLPGKLEKIMDAPPDKPVEAWIQPRYQHGLLAPFNQWSRSATVDFFKPDRFPRAYHYWDVKPLEKEYVLLNYGDKDRRPALLERNLGQGAVLLFTTTLDDRDPRWNNYLESSFYLVLANEVAGYLTGDFHVANFNYLAGQTVPIDLPAMPRFPVYSLQGPGLQGAETSVPRPDGQDKVQLTQAAVPGNFTLLDGDGNVTAGFSLNARPEESQLERVPAEQIETLLGAGAVLPVGHSTNLSDALQGHWGQPVELYPWLMIAVLLVLVLESFLANRFYRRPPHDTDANLVSSPGRAMEAKELAVPSH